MSFKEQKVFLEKMTKIIEEIEVIYEYDYEKFLVQVENKQHLEKTIGAKY